MVCEIAGFCHRADEVFALLGCTQHMFVVVWFTATNTHCIVDGRQVQQEFLFKIQGKKVKCTLVQALRLCTGRMRGRRGIALLFHDHGTRRG
jgi:hypothetical protein